MANEDEKIAINLDLYIGLKLNTANVDNQPAIHLLHICGSYLWPWRSNSKPLCLSRNVTI